MTVALLRKFYRFMIWGSELERELARLNGNFALINKRTERVQYWELQLWELDWRMN